MPPPIRGGDIIQIIEDAFCGLLNSNLNTVHKHDFCSPVIPNNMEKLRRIDINQVKQDFVNIQQMCALFA